jgi:cubilin
MNLTLGFSFSCTCAPGFYGMHCTQRKADCLGGSDLCGPGTCVNTNNPDGYKCICNQGWTTNGITPACTVDVNECTSSKPHCSMDPPVQCINIPGAFVCGNCPAGFTGNGYYCVDINECDVNNGGCSTNPKVTCINTRVRAPNLLSMHMY